MITHTPGHLPAFAYVGLYRYFLTFCTHQRKAAFLDPQHVDVARTQILRAASDDRFEIVACRFMADHLHLLVEAQSESSDARAFIKQAKQLSGFHYQKQFGERLWQRYGFERILRNDDCTLVVARYILENPVRAGLVENPERYRFSGSTTHSLRQVLEAVGDMKRW